MQKSSATRRKKIERYEVKQSPLAQKPTQRQLAKLVKLKRDELRALATYHDTWIVRRDEEINGKLRHLAYPRGKLRVVHELLKFHLKKIKQPPYLFSPRVGRSQRDNAALHLGQTQFLKLDIKQFYPSTTAKHVYRWAREELGMHDDVAGLFTRLATVDGVASFGSPLTPVLATLVHRKIFDTIYRVCEQRGLRMSLWVDDITISGKFIPGVLVREIREIIRTHGLKSHKLFYMTGNRPVAITGPLVDDLYIRATRSLHEQIRGLYGALSEASDDAEAEKIINRLLSALGTLRYTVGRASKTAQKTSDRMNTLRQRRSKLAPMTKRRSTDVTIAKSSDDGNAPWN